MMAADTTFEKAVAGGLSDGAVVAWEDDFDCAVNTRIKGNADAVRGNGRISEYERAWCAHSDIQARQVRVDERSILVS